MKLTTLTCTNFKRYESVSLTFNHRVVALAGPNGSGKTNLLDAIYYLCIGKSYFNPVDQQNFRYGTDFFRITGQFEDKQTYKVVCTNQLDQRKKIAVNGVVAERLSEHLGRFPVVVIAPDDIALINEGSEFRRRFLDFLLSFTSRDYLDTLLLYNKLLQQRNRVLKEMAQRQRWDASLISTYDAQMAPFATQLFLWRQAFISAFTPLFEAQYQMLAGEREQVRLSYESQLSRKDMKTWLAERQSKDRTLQRTTAGIHKDDLELSLQGHALKRYGSQGQKKSALIAMKLAAYTYLQQHTGKKPILLLDDLFDKLDDQRSLHLLGHVSDDSFGQVFITDTSAGRLQELFQKIPVQIDIFDIKDGHPQRLKP